MPSGKLKLNLDGSWRTDPAPLRNQHPFAEERWRKNGQSVATIVEMAG
jgi:hypothetical protein